MVMIVFAMEAPIVAGIYAKAWYCGGVFRMLTPVEVGTDMVWEVETQSIAVIVVVVVGAALVTTPESTNPSLSIISILPPLVKPPQ